MMRGSPFGAEPDIRQPVSLPVLADIADAIERESVRRYQTLAAVMERRGDEATAAAFRVMLDEERKHVGAVERWAAALGPAREGGARFEWRLPAELWGTWDEVATSARLTPYRAFAIAVDNEQRAFALYSYLAAGATDPRVAAEAEKLALEELGHAALMRRWRRQAWHREQREAPEAPPVVTSAEALQKLLARREADIVARHRAVAARLRAVGDDESAALLEQLVPSWTPARDAPAGAPAKLDDDPVHLLVAAQQPLEALADTLEGVLRTLEGELFAQGQRALANVIARLSRIALQTARRMEATPPA